jgi:hypothetical protein
MNEFGIEFCSWSGTILSKSFPIYYTQINAIEATCCFVWSTQFYTTLSVCQLVSACGHICIPITSLSVFLTYLLENGAEVIGAFAKLRRANIYFVMAVCPPVSLCFCLCDCLYVCMYYVLLTCFSHRTTRFPKKGFSWNFLFDDFSKTCYEKSAFNKIRQEYMKTYKHLLTS